MLHISLFGSKTKKYEGADIFAFVLQFSKIINYTYTCNLI